MTVADSARFLAVIAAAEADAMIAVMDAKYKYGFWRPITAIRNGDIDGNDATERAPTWLPVDNTPMHPEYPCAHCIVSSAVAAAIEAMLGTADVGERPHAKGGIDYAAQPEQSQGHTEQPPRPFHPAATSAVALGISGANRMP